MRQTKRFAVVGSDARQAAAGRALARAGDTVGSRWNSPVCRWRSCWVRQSPGHWHWAAR